LLGGNIAFSSSKQAHRPCIKKIGAAARGREHSQGTIETIKTHGSGSMVGFGGFDGASLALPKLASHPLSGQYRVQQFKRALWLCIGENRGCGARSL
jgi:hypothetical protein